jgi:hypothetical protein
MLLQFSWGVLCKLFFHNAITVYRSTNCMFFVANALGYFSLGIDNSWDVRDLFIAYNIVDFFALLFDKSKRLELYAHHTVVLYMFSNVFTNASRFHAMHLSFLTELISIANTWDNIAGLNIYRSCIIVFVRIPVWIRLFQLSMPNTPLLWCVFPSLDFYFLAKALSRIRKIYRRSIH